jgi:hypothetical protein
VHLDPLHESAEQTIDTKISKSQTELTHITENVESAQRDYAYISGCASVQIHTLQFLVIIGFLNFCPPIRILNTRKHKVFGKSICFCSQVRGEDTYSLGSLRKN